MLKHYRNIFRDASFDNSAVLIGLFITSESVLWEFNIGATYLWAVK